VREVKDREVLAVDQVLNVLRRLEVVVRELEGVELRNAG
jgi:hypothetical protein